MTYYRKRPQVKRIIITWAVLFTAVGIISFTYFEKQIRPMIKSIVINYGQSFATDAINEAAREILQNGEYNYDDMVSVNKADSGRILGITSNYVKLNLLKADISLLAQKKISEIADVPIKIPFGTFLGLELTKNMGPDITLKTSLTGGVTTVFKSKLASAGLNQTLHTIEAVINADISVYTTGIDADTSISTNIIIAETVIAGEVPDLYTDYIN